MRRTLFKLSAMAAFALAMTACKTLSPPTFAPQPWARRAGVLQEAAQWQMDGRAAVAQGNQGWQATLTWRQRDLVTEVRLAGPLGVGAVLLTRTPAGVSIDGGAPGAAALTQLQERLGFALPLDDLRYWLLGVPGPGTSFELQRNAQDRAQTLRQDGWSIEYQGYLPVNGDLLPAHLVLSRDDVRVRIVVEHWQWQ